MDAQLVWGTNGEKPEDPSLTSLDPKLKETLCGVFKWHDYYVVKKETFAVAGSEPKKVQMSKKCRIEVLQLGRDWFQVKLFGRRKPDSEEELVVNKKQKMSPGELLVLAGDDVNDSAWFVLLTRPGK